MIDPIRKLFTPKEYVFPGKANLDPNETREERIMRSRKMVGPKKGWPRYKPKSPLEKLLSWRVDKND